MHDDPRLTSFMASVRDAYAASTPPAPGDDLRALFATGLEVDAPPTATTSRRRRMFSDVCKAVPGKVAAGLLGATLAYTGLGAAGALPAPLSLASSEDDIEQVVLDDTTATTLGEDGDTTPATVSEGDGDGDTDADAGTKVAEDVDLALVPVPSSVSEAAHNHDFDEACGNHGKYVSHFARTGTEPECATAARAAAGGDGQDTGTELSTADTDAGTEAVADAKGKGKGKAQKGKGKKSRS